MNARQGSDTHAGLRARSATISALSQPTETASCQRHIVLNSALAHDYRWESASQNAAQAMSVSKKVKPEIRPLSVGEVEAFFEAASVSKYNDVCLLAVHNGMRRSDFLGLTWRDIDIEGQRVGPPCVS